MPQKKKLMVKTVKNITTKAEPSSTASPVQHIRKEIDKKDPLKTQNVAFARDVKRAVDIIAPKTGYAKAAEMDVDYAQREMTRKAAEKGNLKGAMQKAKKSAGLNSQPTQSSSTGKKPSFFDGLKFS